MDWGSAESERFYPGLPLPFETASDPGPVACTCCAVRTASRFSSVPSSRHHPAPCCSPEPRSLFQGTRSPGMWCENTHPITIGLRGELYFQFKVLEVCSVHWSHIKQMRARTVRSQHSIGNCPRILVFARPPAIQAVTIKQLDPISASFGTDNERTCGDYIGKGSSR